jgi:hypothetical protein
MLVINQEIIKSLIIRMIMWGSVYDIMKLFEMYLTKLLDHQYFGWLN